MHLASDPHAVSITVAGCISIHTIQLASFPDLPSFHCWEVCMWGRSYYITTEGEVVGCDLHRGVVPCEHTKMWYSYMPTSIEPLYYGTHSLAVNRNFPFPLPHPLSYIGCCRAVLTEVYEGLMLPLPLELYCSPATNPTLDSSDSDETPLRSLQEPAAPKMVTGNAKRYDFYSMPCGKTLSFVRKVPGRSQIATSFPSAWFATQASKSRSRLL